MKQIHPAGGLQRSSAIVSFDAHLEAVAQGELLVFEVHTENHPRLSPGDILFVDTVPLETCDDKELLLIDFDTEYVLRQKKFVKSIFRRLRYPHRRSRKARTGASDRQSDRLATRLRDCFSFVRDTLLMLFALLRFAACLW